MQKKQIEVEKGEEKREANAAREVMSNSRLQRPPLNLTIRIQTCSEFQFYSWRTEQIATVSARSAERRDRNAEQTPSFAWLSFLLRFCFFTNNTHKSQDQDDLRDPHFINCSSTRSGWWDLFTSWLGNHSQRLGVLCEALHRLWYHWFGEWKGHRYFVSLQEGHRKWSFETKLDSRLITWSVCSSHTFLVQRSLSTRQ